MVTPIYWEINSFICEMPREFHGSSISKHIVIGDMPGYAPKMGILGIHIYMYIYIYLQYIYIYVCIYIYMFVYIYIIDIEVHHFKGHCVGCEYPPM